MPLISVSGRRIVESGSVALGDREKEAILKIGDINLNIKIDYESDTSTPIKATANGADIDVVFPRILTSEVVYWKATISGGGNSYDVTFVGRGMDKDNIRAHIFDFTVSEA
jgi:hypothetical protein